MTNDPISDMLSRIRNAIQRESKFVSVPSTKMLVEIAKILQAEGFINDYEVIKDEKSIQDSMKITLKYVNGRSVIDHLKRISKPGLRRYAGYKDIKKTKNGIGLAIVSTSKGLMTDKSARSEKIGGEVLAEIW